MHFLTQSTGKRPLTQTTGITLGARWRDPMSRAHSREG